jgi:glycosyltransferase involved in cell wall biosynthesis
VRICFVLPGSSPTPAGGVKIVYEHANRLVEKGHAVAVVHAAFVQKGCAAKRLRGAASFVLNRIGVMHWRPDKWFEVDRRVRMIWAPSLAERWIPDADAVVASAWQTAEWVKSYFSRKGRKFYFVQDFERYMDAGPELRIRIAATYTSGLRNMVISPACREVVEGNGGLVACEVPNGLDLDRLRLETPIDDAARTGIGFPNRPERHKGTGDAIAAVQIIRSRTGHPGPYWCFGGERPADLPDWVEHHPRPSDAELVRLYNRSSIFLVPSHYEGWGLPGSEAMACGAALVSTDNGGVRAYAENGKTALLTPIGDPDALAGAACSLIADPAFRIRLAQAGCGQVAQFTWERATGKLERCLLEKG